MGLLLNDVLATGFDLNGNPGQPLFVYDPTSTIALLRIEPLAAEQLAFSSAAGETGNNEVLLDLLGLKNQTITLGGSQVTLNDAYAGLLGTVASDSRQNQADFKSATAVTLDEEVVNLMTFSSGSAPPDRPVPAPRATTGTPRAWQSLSNCCTCSMRSGSTTSIGVVR